MTPASLEKEQLRLYIIDDDELFHIIHTRMLKMWLSDCQIISFTDPVEALHTLTEEFGSQRNSRPPIVPIVLLDINMPCISGWEWLERFTFNLPEWPSLLKIAMLSSSVSPDDVQQAKSHPLLSGYFTKPLTQSLVEKIMHLKEKK
ncbi:response regulator [Cytophagaceae bacterium DM2B3-1]|uniref:Response regulator n=2 Tax=Xanthocytophaga TaxID=3078918 RepID=A0AAE3UA59_9BACT|nr:MULTISPECIES: response regulator [Xanthocytophaga]MDJ1471832.1 response regulator [Xanthocytophaga flavus]MDJ1485819.1 response regulator [Xanthocytophaga flavus]MDJ1497144.1 response regulator [Xanthocytophaga flavus]MDJ1500284.1 response regulator [Xanthocytophaga agilis]